MTLLSGQEKKQIALASYEATLRLEKAIATGSVKNIQKELDNGAVPAWCKWKKKNGKANGNTLGRAMRHKNIGLLDMLYQEGASLYQKNAKKNILEEALSIFEEGFIWALEKIDASQFTVEEKQSIWKNACSGQKHYAMEALLKAKWEGHDVLIKNLLEGNAFSFFIKDRQTLDLFCQYNLLNFAQEEEYHSLLTQHYHALTKSQHQNSKAYLLDGFLNNGGSLDDDFWKMFSIFPYDEVVEILKKHQDIDLSLTIKNQTLAQRLRKNWDDDVKDFEKYSRIKVLIERFELSEQVPQIQSRSSRMRL